jgi:cyclic pyranopterin phosphate synthase
MIDPAPPAREKTMSPFDVAKDPPTEAPARPRLVDGFGRVVDYVRLSVTDRCDLRCVYCMAERQVFLPRSEVLSLEELDRLGSAFVDLGVRRLRLTGGEPLVRRDVLQLVRRLSRHLKTGALDELTLTTNGTRLAESAAALADCGVRRLNVSLDSLDPSTYRRLTRGGELNRVLAGIEAARAAGLKIKINTVALKDDNAAELPALIAWAHGQGFDISLIETMPLGEIEQDRTEQFVSLAEVRRDLERRWTLEPLAERTAGPSLYVRVAETGGRLGFITPLSHNFCAACNRVRVTCTGTLFLCLGREESADLRAPLRAHPTDDAPVRAAILEAMTRKPERHDFHIDRFGQAPALARPMSMTGG